jgi:LacI family transcriptional regulator
MRSTIKDIARRVGMSVTTVSLVLNRKPSRISEDTKRKVLNAARELEYSPNQLATGLITKRTRTLGLIVSDISNIFFSTLVKGIEKVCEKERWSVILCNSWDMHSRDVELIRILTDKRVDGIIYNMNSESDERMAKEIYEILNGSNIPYIEIDSEYSGNARHNVYFDNEKAGYMATRHLIENGHRKIACITGANGIIQSRGRIRGYRDALANAGIREDLGLLVEGNFTMESGFSAVEKLVGKDYTAIFAFNDMMAFGAFKAMKERNIKVPEDISIIGYDDVPFCEILEAPLTTVRQPVYKMGRVAAKNIIKLITSGSDEDTNVTFAPKLIVRKSVKNIN